MFCFPFITYGSKARPGKSRDQRPSPKAAMIAVAHPARASARSTYIKYLLYLGHESPCHFQLPPHAANMTDFTKTYRRTTYPAISPTNPSNSQSGRTICIIGASEGIGFEIAKAYLEAGANEPVIICGRNETKLENAAKKLNEVKPVVEARVLDAGNVEEVKKFWQTIEKTIDVLVLSAAHTDKIDEFDPEQVTKYFEKNCLSKLWMVDGFRRQQHAPPSSSPKVLIDISSAGLMGYPYPKAAYSGSKAGFTTWLCHLSDMIDPEKDMRIVNFHPGAVFTPAAQRSGEASRDLKIWDDRE